MQYFLPLKVKIQRALLGDYSTLSILLGITATLLGIGFATGNIIQNPNYTLLLVLASQYFWAASFSIYGIVKILCSVFRVWMPVKLVATVYGLWLWNYLALSFTVFDKTPLAPTELMLFVMVIGELWALTLILYNRKNMRR